VPSPGRGREVEDSFIRLYDTHMRSLKEAPTQTATETPGAPTADPRHRVSAWCPTPVRTATMVHRWNTLTFLHWRFEPALVQRLLPEGLEVDTFDGSAWVGLVPFAMEVSLPQLPPAPWVSQFPETNVRTYVRAADGTTGIWFLSLDASRLGAVAVARTTYRLPYFWSDMDITRVGPVMTYRCHRRGPAPAGMRSEVAVEIGEPFALGALGDLDRWLTARWRLYSARRSGMRYALADHAPWPLHQARLLHLDDELVTAAGLPRPDGEPLLHWSPGVEVRIGFPHRLRSS
jgi:uncharacterized protein YqjF (DUF2071 family)